ncbi:ABC transporter substrate-binding protein [Pantoea sp. C2G6]|uniref:ABC transporter substrate-binding protein n=1 Tax=Pantoea sp. C2G6 TaxID=3243084 RepID=UPI003ED84CBE
MARLSIRLAVRDWDYFTPLALGDIQPEGFDLHIDRVGTLVNDLATSPDYEAGEVSFSRYAQSRARGDESLLGLPHFLMRGFRQRCIITTASSPITTPAELKGKRVGVTGWQDSGNTWTRTVLREAGVEIDDVRWYAGRLTADHPIADRLAGFGRPGRIEPAPDEKPLIEMLLAGELEAIFTPFMPEGFFLPGSGLRQLQPDFYQAERDYFNRVGYVPGIHILALKPALAAEHPWLPAALSEVIDRSSRLWMQKREKYADTTPWLLDDLRRTAQELPAGWNQNGFSANRKMIADFGRELYQQGLTNILLTPEAIFPAAAGEEK